MIVDAAGWNQRDALAFDPKLSQEREDAVGIRAVHLLDAGLDMAVGDAGAGHGRAQPVDRDDRRCEQQLLAQVRRAERTDKCGEQRLPPARATAGVMADSGWLSVVMVRHPVGNGL